MREAKTFHVNREHPIKWKEKKMRIENLSDTGSLALARAVCVFLCLLSHIFFRSLCEHTDALDFYLPKIKFENRLNDGVWEIKKKTEPRTISHAREVKK